MNHKFKASQGYIIKKAKEVKLFSGIALAWHAWDPKLNINSTWRKENEREGEMQEEKEEEKEEKFSMC